MAWGKKYLDRFRVVHVSNGCYQLVGKHELFMEVLLVSLSLLLIHAREDQNLCVLVDRSFLHDYQKMIIIVLG